MLPGPTRAVSRSRWWVLAGVIATGVVIVADWFADDTILLGALFLGPFIAAFGARTRDVAILSAVAVACAIGLGAHDDIFGTRDHFVRTLVVLVGCIGATLLTHAREQREHELDRTLGAARDAQQLALALEAGQMGTWRWDVRTGRVIWDARLQALYGLAPGTFDGTFDTYASLLHPEDRERVLTTVRQGMSTGTSWRFDHRIRWRDGSEHWLEGRGEPVTDAAGTIVGAAGVSIDIDARYQAESDRAALLNAERVAREQAERSTRLLQRLGDLTLALSGAATVDEVAGTIVHHGLEALDGDYGWFASVDTTDGVLVTRAHEGYPPHMLEPYLTVPLDDPGVPAAEVLRTGEPIYIESTEDRRRRYPQFSNVIVHGSFVVVPIAAFEDVSGVLSFGFLEGRIFSEDDRRYIAAVAEACAQALRRASLLEAEQRSRARLRTLLDFSERLARLDHPADVLEATARFAATRIGRFAIVHAREDDGTLRRAAVVHADGGLQPTLDELVARGADARDIVAKVADTGLGTTVVPLREALVPADHPDAEDDELRRMLDELAPISGIVVAMNISGRTRGVVLIGDDHPVAFGHADLELATDLGRRGASALERAMLWQMSQLQLAAEHHMVEVLQKTIVPERLPEVPGVELAAVYRPADVIVDVGGDWYDVFGGNGEPLALVVGDVAGHGIEAASLMGRVRNGLRAYAVDHADPGALLRKVHELLLAFDPESMVTAVVAFYDPATRVLTWSRAGHPPPLVCEPDGTTRYLEDVNATPLGTMGKNFASAQVLLAPGSLVVLYTDGLIERRQRLIDEGLEWLAERTRALRHNPVDDLCLTLVDRSFATGPSADDICVLALRVTPVDPPA
jgi:PAS domain S-box-containing protein